MISVELIEVLIRELGIIGSSSDHLAEVTPSLRRIF